ncbi:MAG: site-2 protease family protein [Thermoguttaceae bacterium]
MSHAKQSWRIPLILYLLTWITTTALHEGAPLTSLLWGWMYLPAFPDLSWSLVLEAIADGLWFSVPLMIILTAHEFGHFVQSLRYRVAASLPYFIPLPVGPFGTLGAVITMGGRIPNTRALFDIGISGPIAGLIPTLICCYYGILWSSLAPSGQSAGGLIFGDSILFTWLTHLIHGNFASDITLYVHPVGLAGWVGLLLTSLNLMPFGQLDGGHIFYSLCGKWAAVLSRVLFYAVVILVLWFRLWHWILLLVLITLMGISHPPTQNDSTPLGWGRRILGWATLAFVIIGLSPTPLDVETEDEDTSSPALVHVTRPDSFAQE